MTPCYIIQSTSLSKSNMEILGQMPKHQLVRTRKEKKIVFYTWNLNSHKLNPENNENSKHSPAMIIICPENNENSKHSPAIMIIWFMSCVSDDIKSHDCWKTHVRCSSLKKHTWMAKLFPACLPPLITVKAGTGRVR